MSGDINITLKPTDSLQPSLSSTVSKIEVKSSPTVIDVHAVDHIQAVLHHTSTSRIDVKANPAILIQDYNTLKNLPSINGVTLKGNLTSADLYLCKESINTQEYWDSHITYIPDRGEIIIYTDKATIDGITYPGIKIGDGNAYVVDLPFVGDDTFVQLAQLITDHINNHTVHVTAAEKALWDNKLNCQLDRENLIFTRN